MQSLLGTVAFGFQARGSEIEDQMEIATFEKHEPIGKVNFLSVMRYNLAEGLFGADEAEDGGTSGECFVEIAHKIQ